MPKPPSSPNEFLIDFFGVKASVEVSTDQDELESVDFHVCILATDYSHFDDNEFDFCCRCGEKVQFRPGAPVGVKRICHPCMKKEPGADDTVTLLTTAKTAAEMADFLAGRKFKK